MRVDFVGVSPAQRDGSRPKTVVAGSAPGECGLAIERMHFEGSAHLTGVLTQHVVFFQFSPQMTFSCWVAGRSILHEPPQGRLAIAPAGADIVVDTKASLDGMFVALDPAKLALAASEDAAPKGQIVECMMGFDPVLLQCVRSLLLESAADYPSGALYWNEVADGFTSRVISHHMAGVDWSARGTLSKDLLRRLRDYIMDHLDEPVEVAELARMAGRSPFHFTRMFARSVGVTPHRYIVHLRLQRAVEMVRARQCGLAEIAATTGFADQSHLSRWVRRVYGVSLTQFTT